MADVSETTAAEGGSGRRSEGSGRSSEVEPRRGVFARIARFIRQVFAELRKVVRPARRELITYFLVVVVFVLVMMAITGVLDLVFGQLALWTFG
ncbi:MAG: preprotein translocase subunit SecE [Actinomycetaceae bacterium]